MMNDLRPMAMTPRALRLWPVPVRRSAVSSALLLLAMHALPAKADIWGYVDADRVPHFASSRLDDRYELFLQDRVEPYRLMPAPRKAQDEGLEATTALVPASSGSAGFISPRMVDFFERSPSYKAVSPLLREASTTHGIDYSLLKALIATESGFNTFAVSPKGAVGLMQLIPPTAERYGVTAGKGATIEKRLTDPKTNIKAGTRYLAYLIDLFPGRLELALAAYNAGEGAVQRAGNKIPNYPETQNYVKTVMQLYNGLAPSVTKTSPVFKTPAGRVQVEMRSAGRANMPLPLEAATPSPSPSPLSRIDFPRE